MSEEQFHGLIRHSAPGLLARLSSLLFLSARLREMPPKIRSRLISTLFGRASNVLMVGFAAAVCGVTAWRREQSFVLAALSLGEAGLLFVRCAVIVAYQKPQRSGASVDDGLWLAAFGLLAILSSLCWGMMCFTAVMTAKNPIVYMLPVICTVATAGALAARNSSIPRLAKSQLTASLLPLIAGCALAQDDSLRLMLLLVPALAVGLFVLVDERHTQLVTLIETQAELQRLSSTDALTQVANRRAFDANLERTSTPGETVSLLMIDVDRFKIFNDRHGHPEGDRLLQTIALTLQSGLGLRAGDLARVGGEEFGVLLPGADAHAAFAIAEQLRTLVASRCSGSSMGDDITISIGVATVDDGNMRRLLSCADEALYVAKNGGRNRTIGEVRPKAA